MNIQITDLAGLVSANNMYNLTDFSMSRPCGIMSFLPNPLSQLSPTPLSQKWSFIKHPSDQRVLPYQVTIECSTEIADL